MCRGHSGQRDRVGRLSFPLSTLSYSVTKSLWSLSPLVNETRHSHLPGDLTDGPECGRKACVCVCVSTLQRAGKTCSTGR